jgi:hypothetical protein
VARSVATAGDDFFGIEPIIDNEPYPFICPP